ncbi:CehA/McbA family metallohydrolase [Sphingomonas cannabina]|uniref:CehA/McbA family metallohydrolase n=1 Tax=Sphingomonas cannabina TaxID=2899123 RepID=UPI001F3A1A1A|nr:CehA/McbA family metallohydrolase [Sphingomonas cannabina]UIJ47100.1 CehA/McbA family metallohydrolase [Sphingomonas cannabina]
MRTMLALLLALAAALPAAAEEAPKADVHVTGTVTGEDAQHYKEVPFDVPAGVERITVALAYDRSNKTVIDLGVLGPDGFRGWSGGRRDRFTISASDATPGYLPGPVTPGRWRVLMGVPNARQGSSSAYTVDIFFNRKGAANATAAIADPPIRAGEGWYRGDLHMHDANSDGSCTSQTGKRVPCPLYRTVEAAAAAGLDFIAVTDHNTVSHFDGLRELQPWFDKLLLIPGVEITTFRGHANIFGPSRFVDFRVGTPAVPDARALERSVAAAGAIISVNHPALPTGEACMGCGWTWDTDWSGITAIEAINADTATGPLAGTGFWYARLNEGHRLTGIGGSDNHDADAPPERTRIGRPTTVVHARELSLRGIQDGIRAGNVFIDVEGTRDRLLEVEASTGSQRAVMGGELKPTGTVTLAVHVVGTQGGAIELITNGTPVQSARTPVTSADQHTTLMLGPAQPCGWVSVNVVLSSGKPALIGNPIYLRCPA